MRTIIAGSRTITDYDLLSEVMQTLPWTPTLILSGTARGVDRLGELWATTKHLPIERYPAEWDTYGKRAGYLRNELMAQNADAVVLLWDGQSRGTQHMMNLAESYNLQLCVRRVDEN